MKRRTFLGAGLFSAGDTNAFTIDEMLEARTNATIAAEKAREAINAANTAQAAANGNFVFSDRIVGAAAQIPENIHTIELDGWNRKDDGLGGKWTDQNNGSSLTLVSADGRTWYGKPDIERERLTPAFTRDLRMIRPPSIDPARWGNDYRILYRAMETRSINRCLPMSHQQLQDGRHMIVAVTRHFDTSGTDTGPQSRWGTSLFFSTDLERIEESQANPFFSRIDYLWQGQRAMGACFYDDPDSDYHYVFFSADGTGNPDTPGTIQGSPYFSQGTRAIGVARSINGRQDTWEVKSDPSVLVETANILDLYGPLAGDVYALGPPFKHPFDETDAYYYLPIAVGAGALGGQPFITMLIKTLDLWDGEWEAVNDFPILEGTETWEGTQTIGSQVKIIGETMWMAYSGAVIGGVPGKIGLAWRNIGRGRAIAGEWQKTPDPIIEPDFIHDRVVLVPTNGGCKIITSSDNGGNDLVVIFSEGTHPSLLASDPIGGRWSRPLGYRAGKWYFPRIGKIGGEDLLMVAGTYYAVPLEISRLFKSDAIGCYITQGVADSFGVLGVYTNNNGNPAELIFQGPEQSTAAIGNMIAAVTHINYTGIVWLVAQFSAGVRVAKFSAGDSMDDGNVYGFSSLNPTTLASTAGWLRNELAYSATMPILWPNGYVEGSVINLPRIALRAQNFAV